MVQGGTHMLREWKAAEKPEEEELKKRLIAAREKLARQQMLIKEKKVPVLVLMEGWEQLEREAASERLSKTLIRGSLKWNLWRRKLRKRSGGRFCTGILQRFRKRENLYFWILAGWVKR